MTGKLHKLDRTGDTVTTWDTEKVDEVTKARELFDDLRGKGYMAWKVEATGQAGSQTSGKSGTVIREFDPHTEEIILSPPLVGG